MRMYIQSHRKLAMHENFLYYLRVNYFCKQKSRRAVSDITLHTKMRFYLKCFDDLNDPIDKRE